MNILEIEDLAISVAGTDISLVDEVSLVVAEGETVGIVGESGSGKSLTCRASLGLLPKALRATGTVKVAGQDITGLNGAQLRAMRGTQIAMVFQEPLASLNPVLTVSAQIGEAVRHGGTRNRRAVRERAVELLTQVGISEPASRLDQYPHELSGGMCQRVMIAIALAGRPKLLVADEPTTALDVTIQAQILELLAGLVRNLSMGLLLVSHDLGVVAETCQRTLVMYGGRIVESGPTAEVLESPRHPYTSALLASLPTATGPLRQLAPIPGTVPAADAMPTGCRFHPRCPLATPRCAEKAPPITTSGDRTVACWEREVRP